MRGIVFDLPETVRDEKALGERIEFVEGSFFESVPEGDVYGPVIQTYGQRELLVLAPGGN